ncbi:pseudouridine synthase [Paraphysoderma sedebokerense]|nr:pseudouridine synthase [Paraphysoderma sedebokerense]
MALFHQLNGIFSVHKPTGMGSTDVVRRLERLLKTALKQDEPSLNILTGSNGVEKRRFRIGHGGTLDPLAEGVLMIGVGKGTKQLTQFLNCTKEYIATGKLGTATDSYDATGSVTITAPFNHVTKQLLETVLPQFRGQISQLPPIYSALKQSGKPLYHYARKNLPLPKPIEPRLVAIHELELLDFSDLYTSPSLVCNATDSAIQFKLRISCSGGTYIRSIVHDLGVSLDSAAHMDSLIRTRQGEFHLDDALKESEWTLESILRALKE